MTIGILPLGRPTFDVEFANEKLAAMLASGSRRKALRGVKVPTLVIHGVRGPKTSR